jgi:transposase
VELEPDYAATYLLPPSVEDWIGADHPARFIRELVDSVDLNSLGIQHRKSKEGRSNYSGSMLLKLWLYGYFFHCRSSRKLERACSEAIGAIWLAGQMCPDHNTLWRFWKNNRKVIDGLFKMSVRVACKAGLVGMVFNALDGTKILSMASRRSALHKEDLLEALEKIDQLVATIGEQIEAAQQAEQVGMKLELADMNERRAAIAKAIEQLEAEGLKSVHPVDPDANMMMTNTGRIEWAYNAQCAVDDSHNIIVAADVSTSAVDDHNLKCMLDQVHENVGSVAERTLVDATYGHSEDELAQVEATQYPVVTARPKHEREAYDGSKFVFDREQQSLVCPQGHSLTFQGTLSRSHGLDGRMMEFECKCWKQCPVRELCCGRTRKGELRARRVRIGPNREAAERQRQVVTREQRKLLMHRRLGIVEPCFARMKCADGFVRFAFGTKEKVRTQFRMLAAVHNLRILMKHWVLGTLTFAKDFMSKAIPQMSLG